MLRGLLLKDNALSCLHLLDHGFLTYFCLSFYFPHRFFGSLASSFVLLLMGNVLSYAQLLLIVMTGTLPLSAGLYVVHWQGLVFATSLAFVIKHLRRTS